MTHRHDPNRSSGRRPAHGWIVSIVLMLLAMNLAFPMYSSAQPSGEGSGDAEGSSEPGKVDDARNEAADGADESEPFDPAEHPVESLFDTTPSGEIIVISVDGDIAPGRAAVLERALGEAEDAALIIVRMNTFGGRVDSAVTMRDALLRAEAPVVVYVEDRAISAGALITYAADLIVFSPQASMGAATPFSQDTSGAAQVDEKMVSYMRAEMRATAEANDRRTDVAEAMVDARVEIDGFVGGDELLTVTTSQAVSLGIADGVAEDLDALIESLGARGAEVREMELTWAEKLALFLTSPAVAGILMTLGLLGLWIELQSPGVGLPGAMGVLCLGAFFFGHYLVVLAGWEELLLLVLGMGLLALEVFVIPGFGVAGVLGLLAIGLSLALAMVGLPLGVSFAIGALNMAAFRVVISLVGFIAGALVLARLIPTRAFPKWLVLQDAIEKTGGVKDIDTNSADAPPLLGATGEAATVMRPSGKALIDGRIVDVVSRHAYIEKGEPVKVVEVAGVRVVVERNEAPDGAQPTTDTEV